MAKDGCCSSARYGSNLRYGMIRCFLRGRLRYSTHYGMARHGPGQIDLRHGTEQYRMKQAKQNQKKMSVRTARKLATGYSSVWCNVVWYGTVTAQIDRGCRENPSSSLSPSLVVDEETLIFFNAQDRTARRLIFTLFLSFLSYFRLFPLYPRVARLLT